MVADRYLNLKKITFSNSNSSFEDLLDFSIGDPDLVTNQGIIDYAFAKTKAGETHYTLAIGKEELRKEIISYHQNRFNEHYALDQIQVTNSASHAMYLILNAILNPMDEVVVIAPFFPNYLQQIALNGGVSKICYTRFEDGFQIDEQELLKVITKKTKALILNNPCNPSGVYFNEQSYQIIARICKKYHIYIIADNIYTIFTYQEEFKNIADYEDLNDQVIQIWSFSKDFCMTGWRLGYIIASEDIIKVTSFINENIVYSPNVISQNGAIYGLMHYQEIQKDIYDVYLDRVNYTYSLIKKSKHFDAIIPQGTFYIFLNIEKTGLDADTFSALIYEKLHIKVFSGILFGGQEYRYFVRLALNLPKEKIKEAFDKMDNFDYESIR